MFLSIEKFGQELRCGDCSEPPGTKAFAKGILLHGKRIGFIAQKHRFWSTKGHLLQCKMPVTQSINEIP